MILGCSGHGTAGRAVLAARFPSFLEAGVPARFFDRRTSREYGFYSNANPDVDRPRWSQRTEQRIGEHGRRPTLMFNGYQAGGPETWQVHPTSAGNDQMRWEALHAAGVARQQRMAML